MKILVTGGAGFIGSHLVETLLNDGHEVHVLDDLSTGTLKNIPFLPLKNFHKGSITNPACFNNFKVKFDVIFHLAAKARVQPSFVYPAKYHDVNILGTANVLEFARTSGVKKVIFASSSSVYGGQGAPVLTEDLPKNPISPYAASKAIGEDLLREYAVCFGLTCFVARFFNVYGDRMLSGQYSTVMQIFFDAKKKGRPLPVRGDGLQTRNFTHVSDVVAGLIKLMLCDTGGFDIFNIGHSQPETILKLAQLFEWQIKYEPPVVEPKHNRADNHKMARFFGWHPKIDMETGVLELIKKDNA